MGGARSRDLVKTGLSLDHSCWTQGLCFPLTSAHLMTFSHGGTAAGRSLVLGNVRDFDCSEEGTLKPRDFADAIC